MGSPFILINDARSFRAGNVSNFLDQWRHLSDDPWIHEVVQGVEIPLWNVQPQLRVPFPYKFSDLERTIVDQEIINLGKKVVIELAWPEPGQVISNIFLRPKPDGNFRVILDLTELNKQVPYEHFKMTSLTTALEMMRPGCWMASVDLKDAYYSVPISGPDRKLLRFWWKGCLYQFTALPNGLACAPRVFTKLLTPIYSNLHEEGHACFPYIDDSFVVGDSGMQCRETAERLCRTLDRLGFYIHKQKSVLEPAQEITFLGFQLNSVEMSVSLTQDKKEKFRRAAKGVLTQETLKVREVAGLVGLMTAYSPAVEYGGAHIKNLEKDKNVGLRVNKGNFEGFMRVSKGAKNDIRWWVNQLEEAKKTN